MLAEVGGLFYFWIGAAVLTLLWIAMSLHGFKKRGKFVIIPGQGLTPGDVVGRSQRALLIFTAIRVAAIVLFVVLGLVHLHAQSPN